MFVAVVALGLLTANSTAANAIVKKTITCYKGTAVKKVTAVNPKCALGWSLKKPVVKPTPKPTVKPSAGLLAFSGTYKGKIAMLWSDSDVQATSV